MKNTKPAMKQIALIFSFLLTTGLCLGQENHLKPARDFSRYEGVLKEYYDNLFLLLYTGFSQKPYARYTSKPSFSQEYAFSVEMIEGKCFILSNSLSENYWYAKDKKSVRMDTSKIEINQDLYLKIGELFDLLLKQTKVPERKFKKGPNGEVYEIETIVFDGTVYYFTITGKDGKTESGETSSPGKNSVFGRLVKICDELHSLEFESPLILKEIDLLVSDLKQ